MCAKLGKHTSNQYIYSLSWCDSSSALTSAVSSAFSAEVTVGKALASTIPSRVTTSYPALCFFCPYNCFHLHIVSSSRGWSCKSFLLQLFQHSRALAQPSQEMEAGRHWDCRELLGTAILPAVSHKFPFCSSRVNPWWGAYVAIGCPKENSPASCKSSQAAATALKQAGQPWTVIRFL